MTAECVVAWDSAVYPRGVCEAMLRGVAEQLKEDSLVRDGCFGIQVPDDDAAIEPELRAPQQGFLGRFRDDLTGQVLNDELVIKARAVELSFFHPKGVLDDEAQEPRTSQNGASTYIRTMGGC